MGLTPREALIVIAVYCHERVGKEPATFARLENLGPVEVTAELTWDVCTMGFSTKLSTDEFLDRIAKLHTASNEVFESGQIHQVHTDELPYLATFPLGVVVIGESPKGWADEMAFLPDRVATLAAAFGRSPEEERGRLEEWTYGLAGARIQELQRPLN
jgi:hypothetical protein